MITPEMKARAQFAALARTRQPGDRERQSALSAWYGEMITAGFSLDGRDAAYLETTANSRP